MFYKFTPKNEDTLSIEGKGDGELHSIIEKRLYQAGLNALHILHP